MGGLQVANSTPKTVMGRDGWRVNREDTPCVLCACVMICVARDMRENTPVSVAEGGQAHLIL